MTRAIAIGGAVALALALAPPPAGAASVTEVAGLLTKPCPTEYRNVFQRQWSPSEQEAALAGDFPVLQGRRSKTLVPPVDWEQDPYRSLSWRHWLHTLGWWMDALFFIDHAGGPNATAALERARDLTLDWIAHNPVGPPDPNNPPWAPKPTADRAPYMAYLARRAACKGLLSSAQAEVLLDSLREHAAYLIGHHPPTTKGLWADYGLALTGQYLDGILPEAGGWQALAIERFKPGIASRLEPREFMWLTNSANYQAMIAHLIHLFHTDVDPDPELGAIVARMREALGWFVLPDRSLTLFGSYHTNVPLQPWVEQAGAGHRGLHAMRRSGFAFVRRPRSYLATAASYFSDSHKHADDLSFELYERGHRLISDTGHHDFDRSRWEAFAKSAGAHSVLTVDGADFAIRDAAYGSGILATGEGAGWFAILGRNPSLLRQGVRHKRLFLHRPGRRLVLIDLVRSRRSHRYRRHLQIGTGISARRTGANVVLSAPGLRASVSSSGPGRPRITKGQRRPLRGWLFPDTDQKIPRPTVTYGTRARNAALVTEIRLGRGGGPVPRGLKAETGTMRIALSHGRRSTLVVERNGARLGITVRR